MKKCIIIFTIILIFSTCNTYQTGVSFGHTDNISKLGGFIGGGGGSLGGSIIKTGGIIYGNDVNGTDTDGILLRNKTQNDTLGGCGYAVFIDNSLGINEKLRRNISSYETNNLNSSISGYTGGWKVETEVTVEMWCNVSEGWRSALRINVNGINLSPNIGRPAYSGNPYFSTFKVYSGDAVMFYWVNGDISNDYNCAFAVYFSNYQPNPVFHPSSGSWSPVNDPEGKILLYKQYS